MKPVHLSQKPITATDAFLDTLTGPCRDTFVGEFTWSNNDRRFLKFRGLSTADMAFITRKAEAAQMTTTVPEFATLNVWL